MKIIGKTYPVPSALPNILESKSVRRTVVANCTGNLDEIIGISIDVFLACIGYSMQCQKPLPVNGIIGVIENISKMRYKVASRIVNYIGIHRFDQFSISFVTPDSQINGYVEACAIGIWGSLHCLLYACKQIKPSTSSCSVLASNLKYFTVKLYEAALVYPNNKAAVRANIFWYRIHRTAVTVSERMQEDRDLRVFT